MSLITLTLALTLTPTLTLGIGVPLQDASPAECQRMWLPMTYCGKNSRHACEQSPVYCFALRPSAGISDPRVELDQLCLSFSIRCILLFPH